MTVEEKRDMLYEYCGDCKNCKLRTGDWKHLDINDECLFIRKADEDELDRALALINGTAPTPAAEFTDCDHCEYCDFDEETEPCASCKHNQLFGTKAYESAPDCFRPQGAPATTIKDSGDRTEFTTGAVRDMHTGKGRMDLLPWAAIMEVSKHCENGALKYGEHNIDRGIPTSSLCDSAARHLAKHIDGWTDEPHLLAAAWNLLWAIQMEIKHPELVDVPWRVKPDVEVNSAEALEQIREE